MQIYLVIVDFQRRKNKRGDEYGMPVSIMLPPETVWGYDKVTTAYSQKPVDSWNRIFMHVKEMYPDADDADVIKVIGKPPV